LVIVLRFDFFKVPVDTKLFPIYNKSVLNGFIVSRRNYFMREASQIAAPKKLTDQQRQEIIQLRKEGFSYAALAGQYNVDWRTISRICNPAKYEKEKKQNIEYNKKASEKIFATRANNQKYYKLVLTKDLDEEIIVHLSTKKNVNRYVLDLIRKDMRSSK